GEIRADGNLPRSVDRAGPETELVSLALWRRLDRRRGDQRARVSGDRRLRQAGVESAGRAVAPGSAVEIRLQVDQVDRALQLHRSAAEELLGGVAGRRIRLLGERQSAGAAPALEPGDGRGDRAQ